MPFPLFFKNMDANWNNLIGSTVLLLTGKTAKIVSYNNSYLKVICKGEQSITSIKPEEIISLVKKPDYSDREDEFVRILESESGISREQAQIQYKSRKGTLVEFRNLHMLFRNSIMKLSLSFSGSIYKKDHATTLHAKKKLSEWFQNDKCFRSMYSETIKFITDLNEDAFNYEPRES